MNLLPLGRIQTLSVAALAAGALAGPVLACGDGWMGENLVATASVKSALRSAYVAANPRIAPARVSRPVSGRTYYGSYSGTRYAVATFTVGSAPAYPTIFRTDQRGRWHVRQQTRGAVCTDVVPTDLIMVWWLEHSHGRCFVEPA
jgi:hypothetical protein